MYARSNEMTRKIVGGAANPVVTKGSTHGHDERAACNGLAASIHGTPSQFLAILFR
jgi:hypothetical protein